MKIFLDTNILLDFVTERDGVEEASEILQMGGRSWNVSHGADNKSHSTPASREKSFFVLFCLHPSHDSPTRMQNR